MIFSKRHARRTKKATLVHISRSQRDLMAGWMVESKGLIPSTPLYNLLPSSVYTYWYIYTLAPTADMSDGVSKGRSWRGSKWWGDMWRWFMSGCTACDSEVHMEKSLIWKVEKKRCIFLWANFAAHLSSAAPVTAAMPEPLTSILQPY